MLEFCLLLILSAPAADPVPGSLLFLEHSNKAVERFTEAEIGHVAVILPGEGGPIVYEATPPRVRKLEWDDYLEELVQLNRRRDEPIVPLLAEPKRAWTEAELACMKALAESQLDRPYSVKGHLRDRPAEGVHCAELATMCLQTADQFPDDLAYRFSPQILRDRSGSIYLEPHEVPLDEVVVPELGWCARQTESWSSFWMWCKWSCWESFRYCW